MEHLKKLPKLQEPTPLVCQIFNWSETPMVTGVRLPVLLGALGADLSGARFLSLYSADGMYFETLPRALAKDPRVLLVYEIEGERLPHEPGGPVCLWVPFLQGYKSVKWLNQVRGFVRAPPHGIKRLLGQSKTSVLGVPGQEKAHVVVADGHQRRLARKSLRKEPLTGLSSGSAKLTTRPSRDLHKNGRLLCRGTDK